MTDQREPQATEPTADTEPTGDVPRTGDDWPEPAGWVRDAGDAPADADAPDTDLNADTKAPDVSPDAAADPDAGTAARTAEPTEFPDDRTQELAAADRPEPATDPETQVLGGETRDGDSLPGTGHHDTESHEPATQVLSRDPDPEPVSDPDTKLLGAEDPAAPFGGSGLFRDEDDTVTKDAVVVDDAKVDDRVVDPDDDADTEADRAAARAATRAERNRALGKVSRPEPEPPAAVIPASALITTDKWHGSLALFVLRLILGGIFFVRGIQHLTSLADTQTFIGQNTILPYPEILGWVLAIGELLIAVSLIFGFLVRVAGLGALAIGVMALVLVLWGVNNPFQQDVPGFTGELELLIAGVGLLFLLLGGGRWGLDGLFRRRRRLKKEAAGR